MTEIERQIEMLTAETRINIEKSLGLTVIASYTTKDDGEGQNAYGILMVVASDGNTYKVHIEQYR